MYSRKEILSSIPEHAIPKPAICIGYGIFLCKLYVWLLVLILFYGCGNDSTLERDGRIVSVVSVEPHAFLVEQIGGEFVRVEVLVPMGKEPESYQPTPEKIIALTRAKVFFRTGMPFEQIILPKLKSFASGLKVVDLRTGIKLRKLEFHQHDTHDAHDTHEHANSDFDSDSNKNTLPDENELAEGDPHIWFSLDLLRVEAATVLRTFIEIDPKNEELYRKNYSDFISELNQVKEKLSAMLEPIKGKSIFVFHPTYGYFCDEFNLNQRAIEIGGKTPRPQQLVAIINEIKKNSSQTNKKTTLFVQPEFNRTPINSVSEAVNGRIVEHSALERNIFKSMTNFAEEITR
ncbi:MAG: zinc ABC transporter substrate-binding protein [Planctomycetaceae bacterium]|jgi:zinc transport system substrate-binding protein|nr:zinc ABC transporter substrate-binding protein [Planctomycetaceae bacterium]